MASPLRTGQIVWAEIADANGIRKTRPAIIVTPDESISDSGSIDSPRLPADLLTHSPMTMSCCLGTPRGIPEPDSNANVPPCVLG
jgi:hypothetical protein